MNWITFSVDTRIKLNGNSKKIVELFGKHNDKFHANKGKKPRTRFIKIILINLGHELGFKVYANGLIEKDLREIDRPFVNREWLLDLHWYSEGLEPYSVESLPLAVECEWYPKRNADSKVPYSGIKYDFQKLVVINAELRLMIFNVNHIDDLLELSNYFENVISNYKYLDKYAQFLFVAFDNKAKSFHFKEIIRIQAN